MAFALNIDLEIWNTERPPEEKTPLCAVGCTTIVSNADEIYNALIDAAENIKAAAKRFEANVKIPSSQAA